MKDKRTTSRKRTGQSEKPGKEAAEHALPPRRKAHPSNKLQTARLFYHVLVVCFLLLMAGLIVWGVRFLE